MINFTRLISSIFILGLLSYGDCMHMKSLGKAFGIIAAIQNLQDVTIMPLGASITWGYRSTKRNGYRLDLVEDLNANLKPHTFTCVGNVHSGNTTQSAFSQSVSSPGRVIAQAHSNATHFLASNPCPNITLIHAGTDDIVFNEKVAQAPTRMGSLLDTLYATCPDMVTYVAQLIISKNPRINAEIETFNAAIPRLVNQRAEKGMRVVTVNMHDILTDEDMFDYIHPNDVGYAKMATTWHAAIQADAGKGWW